MKQTISVCALLLCSAASGMAPLGSPLAFNSRCGQFRIYPTPIKAINQEVWIKTENNLLPLVVPVPSTTMMSQEVHVKVKSGTPPIAAAAAVSAAQLQPPRPRPEFKRQYIGRLEAMTPPILSSMIPATVKRPAALKARQKWQKTMQKLRKKHK